MAGPKKGGNKNFAFLEMTRLLDFSLSLCPSNVETAFEIHIVFMLKSLLTVTNKNFKFSAVSNFSI